MTAPDDARRVAADLARIMAAACDRTRSRERGVLVPSCDWHGLMDLATRARAILIAEDVRR